MAKDHRITGPNGSPLDFTCENRRFQTNTGKGHPHGAGEAKGSVLPQPLYSGEGSSLWLEHVSEKDGGGSVFWLMWYSDGKPTIPASGVFGASDLDQIISSLSGLRPSLL